MTLIFDQKAYSDLLTEFLPKVIDSDEEYEAALNALEKLAANRNATPEQNELIKLLVQLIEAYEQENHPIEESSPHEILLHLMDAQDLKQADLVGILGSKGVVSEVVNGKRAISKSQAKALADFFHVSPALFI